MEGDFRPTSVGARVSASVNQCTHAQLRTFRDENVQDDIYNHNRLYWLKQHSRPECSKSEYNPP